MRPEGSGAPVARGLKAIALVDGEHYPEVTLAALRHIEEDLGYELPLPAGRPTGDCRSTTVTPRWKQ
jgi:hypothetical protein